MKQYTPEEIQARFEKLPPEIQAVVTSPEIREKIRAISNKHDLHIDQFGGLVDEIGLIMLGFRKSSTFVSDIVRELSIPQKVAENVARDINTELFSTIRKQMQEIENDSEKEDQQTSISSIEKVGGFDIETEKTLDTITTPTPNREQTLAQIENPPHAPSAPLPKYTHTEPLIDHLLENHVGLSEEKNTVVHTPEKLPTVEKSSLIHKAEPHTTETKPVVPQPPRRTGPDPYRESA